MVGGPLTPHTKRLEKRVDELKKGQEAEKVKADINLREIE